MDFDNIDLAILREIQTDSRISNSELARRVNLSQPATHTRLKRLEKQGVVQEYVALLDRDALGLDMVCFVQIGLLAHSESALNGFQTAIGEMPEVLECYHLTGQFDYSLKVVLPNRRELERFLRTKIVPMTGINRISTSIVLSEIKATTALPLPD